MKKTKISVILTVIFSVFIAGGVIYAASYNVTSTLGGSSGDFFDLDGTMIFDSIKVGAQDVGGVTFFNGTIVNDTTTSGADNPVTFGDNVRIDGRLYRGASAGTTDALPLIVNDNMEVKGTLTVDGNIAGTGIVNSNNILDDSISTTDLADNVVTSAKISDGVIAAADLADDSVTRAKINNGSVATADLADDSVTPGKINGTGGANLPIAYGFVNSDGTLQGGTSNLSSTWSAGNGRYEITITDENFYYNEYVTVVTPITDGLIPGIDSMSDQLVVNFVKHDGTTGQQSDFSFIIYKY